MTEAHFSDQLSLYFKKYGYFTRREVDTGYGIADIVLAKENRNNCLLRKSHGQNRSLLREKFFTVLRYIPDIDGASYPASFQLLLKKTKLSKSYLKYELLNKLQKYKFVKKKGNGYVKVNGWVPLTDEILAIESKLKDWNKGIKQACRYKTFANKVYLAVPPETEHLINLEQLKRNHIGLVVFNPNRCIFKVVLEARKRLPSKEEKMNYVAEIFWKDFLQKTNLQTPSYKVS